MFRDSSDGIEEFTISVTGFINKSIEEFTTSVTGFINKSIEEFTTSVTGFINKSIEEFTTSVTGQTGYQDVYCEHALTNWQMSSLTFSTCPCLSL
jgi:23S rRNA pseudoU1915 N3-methylase RlmH